MCAHIHIYIYIYIERERVGQHMFGKAWKVLCIKGNRLEADFIDNREHLVCLARSTNTVIANTFAQTIQQQV